MDSARFEHLMELDRSGRIEDVIQEAQSMLAETTDANEKASVLINICVSYAKLDRLTKARHTLDELQQLEILHLGLRLNAEFCEPTLLIQEGKYDEGLSAFAAMLNRHSEAFEDPKYRYLYEDIQCRRALTLFRLSRFEEALPILKEAASFSLNQAADEQQVHFALGVCLEDTNDTEAAKQEFIRVIGSDLKNELEERARYRLAIICFNARAFAQAKQQLEMILQNRPDTAAAVPRRYVYEQLAHTHRHLGNKTNAKLYIDLARKSNPE